MQKPPHPSLMATAFFRGNGYDIRDMGLFTSHLYPVRIAVQHGHHFSLFLLAINPIMICHMIIIIIQKLMGILRKNLFPEAPGEQTGFPFICHDSILPGIQPVPYSQILRYPEPASAGIQPGRKCLLRCQ